MPLPEIEPRTVGRLTRSLVTVPTTPYQRPTILVYGKNSTKKCDGTLVITVRPAVAVVSSVCCSLVAAVMFLSPNKVRASAMLISAFAGNENPTSSYRLETFGQIINTPHMSILFMSISTQCITTLQFHIAEVQCKFTLQSK